MLLSALVLAAALAPQDASTSGAVKSTDMPSDSAAQGAIDAGLAAFKKRRFAVAEKDFLRAKDAAPESAAPYFYLGYTYYKQAEKKRPFHPDKEKAREMFAKAYSIDPGFRPVWGERVPKS